MDLKGHKFSGKFLKSYYTFRSKTEFGLFLTVYFLAVYIHARALPGIDWHRLTWIYRPVKITFGAKIGKNGSFLSTFLTELVIFHKIHRIRQSDCQSDVCAKFQLNPTVLGKNNFLDQKNPDFPQNK